MHINACDCASPPASVGDMRCASNRMYGFLGKQEGVASCIRVLFCESKAASNYMQLHQGGLCRVFEGNAAQHSLKFWGQGSTSTHPMRRRTSPNRFHIENSTKASFYRKVTLCFVVFCLVCLACLFFLMDFFMILYLNVLLCLFISFRVSFVFCSCCSSFVVLHGRLSMSLI